MIKKLKPLLMNFLSAIPACQKNVISTWRGVIPAGPESVLLFCLQKRRFRTSRNDTLCRNLKLLLFTVTWFISAASAAYAHVQNSSAPVLPVFIADAPNPNDYQLFANGGWDGNWAIKANTCWIQKVHVAQSSGPYRAFLGAKIGRAKTRSSINPLLAQGLEGQIYIAVNSTFGWKSKQSFLLTENRYVPLQGLDNSAVEGVASAQWFWTEIPTEALAWQADNYIALWTPSQVFVDASSSSILAAAWGNGQIDSWVVQQTKGKLPSKIEEKSLVPITFFEPAIALKLVAQQPENKAQVRIVNIEDGAAKAENLNTKIVWASVQVQDLVSVWLQASKDGEHWVQVERPLHQAPYAFTVNLEEILRYLGSSAQVRVVAEDVNQTLHYSETQLLFNRK